MAQQFTPEVLHAARMQLIQAIARIIVRFLESNPSPGHREWDGVKTLARTARDMDRANWSHPGPAEGPRREWETLSIAYLERPDRPGADELVERLAGGEPVEGDLAEQAIREGLSLPPGF